MSGHRPFRELTAKLSPEQREAAQQKKQELLQMMADPVSYKFAICLNAAPDSNLEIWKIYRVLNDPNANEVGCLRIIDESGEDYLYPESRFAIVEFPDTIQSQLLAAINA
jgi:hypothetical protein